MAEEKSNRLTNLEHSKLYLEKVVNYSEGKKQAMRVVIRHHMLRQEFILKMLDEFHINKTQLKKAASYNANNLMERLAQEILDPDLLTRTENALVILARLKDLKRFNDANSASHGFDPNYYLDRYTAAKEKWEKEHHLRPELLPLNELTKYNSALSRCYSIVRGHRGATKLTLLHQLDTNHRQLEEKTNVPLKNNKIKTKHETRK